MTEGIGWEKQAGDWHQSSSTDVGVKFLLHQTGFAPLNGDFNLGPVNLHSFMAKGMDKLLQDLVSVTGGVLLLRVPGGKLPFQHGYNFMSTNG